SNVTWTGHCELMNNFDQLTCIASYADRCPPPQTPATTGTTKRMRASKTTLNETEVATKSTDGPIVSTSLHTTTIGTTVVNLSTLLTIPKYSLPPHKRQGAIFDIERQSKYTGEVNARNEPDGKGEYTWSGAKFEGEFRNGKFNGRGKLVYRGGDVYVGQWKDDKRHGVGKMNWTDGRLYEGGWINNAEEGYGVKKWKRGSRYEGAWVNGKRIGEGVYTDADGDRYEGTWVGDKKEGNGIFTSPGKGRYEGEFKNGTFHGRGTRQNVEGDMYEGQWKYGQRDGVGTRTWSNGDR
ncbi:unnamed protein product, partial [Didymodactylos carnosus]